MAFRGSTAYGARSIVTFDLSEYMGKAQLLAQTNRKFEQSFTGLHLRLIGLFAQSAESKLRQSIVRPQESGMRATSPSNVSKGRMTGRFTFGARSGGAFKGNIYRQPENHIYGFGYPNVRHASNQTGGVWKVLEFGLKGKMYHAEPGAAYPSDSEYLPTGVHKVPIPHPRYTNVFIPTSRAVKWGRGLRGKRFIRDTGEEFKQRYPGYLVALWKRHFK